MTHRLLDVVLLAAMMVGTWGAHAQNIEVDPLAVDFGILDVGESASTDVVLRSVGPTPLTVTRTLIEDDLAGAFSVDGPVGTTILIPGEFAVSAVEFVALDVGVFTGTLRILSDAGAGNDVFDVPLRGIGREASSVPAPLTLLLVATGLLMVSARPKGRDLVPVRTPSAVSLPSCG